MARIMGRDQNTIYLTVLENNGPISIYDLTCKIEGISYSLIRHNVQVLVERGFLEYVDGNVSSIHPEDQSPTPRVTEPMPAPHVPNQVISGDQIQIHGVYKRKD